MFTSGIIHSGFLTKYLASNMENDKQLNACRQKAMYTFFTPSTMISGPSPQWHGQMFSCFLEIHDRFNTPYWAGWSS